MIKDFLFFGEEVKYILLHIQYFIMHCDLANTQNPAICILFVLTSSECTKSSGVAFVYSRGRFAFLKNKCKWAK